jgi:hypothetical protein
MIIHPGPSGLYVFPLHVEGKKKKRVLKAVFDPGSTDCACNYEVITTLQIRPVGRWALKLGDVNEHRLVYSAPVGFDNKHLVVPIVRMNNLANGIHFIFGNSILNGCNYKNEDGRLEVTWK